MVEIYPREGTETAGVLSAVSLGAVEIYPREGTETTRRSRQDDGRRLKFIPVRGRKLALLKNANFLLVEIYPREGAETICNYVLPILDFVEIYPREGMETLYGFDKIALSQAR